VTDLSPQTAFGADTPRTLQIGALSLAENATLALVSVALLRGASLPKLGSLELPGPGKMHQNGGHFAFWTGPQSWMIGATGTADAELAADVQRATGGCAVCDQSDAWVGFDVISHSGEAPILRLMEKMINLNPSRLTSGHALRSIFDHMPIFALRPTPDQLLLLGTRSAAFSFWDALARSAGRLNSGPAY
jgi:heterotetrameric sarcosine oxidase gamma subunit